MGQGRGKEVNAKGSGTGDGGTHVPARAPGLDQPPEASETASLKV